MLLPAQVPEIPVVRTQIVRARLARNIATLFGIRWTNSPYPLTWVCEYSALTVSEIARGAPINRVPVRIPDTSGPWSVIDRVIVSSGTNGGRSAPLPTEIPTASLNRFGPDTKAALVLTAANVLLAPVTASIREAMSFLHERAGLSEHSEPARVVAWAALTLDAYRTQPALVHAALQARRIQRANLHKWEFNPDLLALAHCEVGGDATLAEVEPRTHPSDFHLIDGTLEATLFGPKVPDAQPGHKRHHDELIECWLARIECLGTNQGDGQLWVTNNGNGHYSVEAFVPQNPILDGFLDEIRRPLHADGQDSTLKLPSIPTADELKSSGVLTRRCIVLALCTLIRLSFASGDPDPLNDLPILVSLEALDDLVAGLLPRSDPAAMIARTRCADMRLELLRQDLRYDPVLPAAFAALTDSLQMAHELARWGLMSSADAAELTFSGAVELLAVLRRHRAKPIKGLPPIEQLVVVLRDLWARSVRVLEPSRFVEAEPLTTPIGFYLHNYATFLGAQDSLGDIQRACELFERVVIPQRHAYYMRTGDFRPLLHSLQNATRANTRLIEDAVRQGDEEEACDRARAGRAWIREALHASQTQRILDRSLSDASDEACRFALLACPALLAAVEMRASPTPDEDAQICAELIEAASRFADRIAKTGGSYSRASEITALIDRLKGLR
jgi:hypothetical protein